jgi:CRISPR-associated protein Cas2
MELLVAYDVTTTTAAGRKRLRKMAKRCEANGQRVQNSVFECILNAAQKELFIHDLRQIMDEEEDSLRIYRLHEPREKYVEAYGRKVEFDLHGALIV